MYYGPSMVGASSYALPTFGGWTWDADRNLWLSQGGVWYEYALNTNAKWWLDFTIDRLFSERWILDIKDWKWGIRVELFATFWADYGSYSHYETCFNFGLLSKKLTINL